MNLALLLRIGSVFAVLSLVSIGGANAIVPEVRRQVVDVHHWMDASAFAHLFALGNVAPGPNVLLVSLIGWRVAGPAGLVVATLAILGPSSVLAFFVGRGVARWSQSPWIARLRAGLAPVAIGLILASGLTMMRQLAGAGAPAAAIGVAAAVYVLASARNPVWAVVAGAAAAVGAQRLGLLP